MAHPEGQDAPTPAAVSEDAPTPAAVSEDAKARFREALDRKKATSRRTSQGSGNTGAVHGSETSGPTQRTFRRRSGSS